MSVNVGGTVNFKIDTPSTNYRIDIYRLGYYGGVGARKVASVEPSAALPQRSAVVRDRARERARRLRQLGRCRRRGPCRPPRCRASTSPSRRARMAPSSARPVTSCSSSATIRSRPTSCSRPRTPPGRPTTTTAATACIAAAPISNAGSAYGCSGRAAKVSYNRPFDTRVTSNASWLFSAEYPMVRFLEANGYNVKYWSGVDTRSLRRQSHGRPHQRQEAQGLPVGGPRRVLVGRAAHQRRERAQRRRQPRVPERQRSVLEDALGIEHRRLRHAASHAGQLQGHARRRQARSDAGRHDRHLA